MNAHALPAAPADTTTGKRKRSPSVSSTPMSAPAPKASKPNSSQLSINYLARHSQGDLPLLTKDDTLPNLLHLLSEYGNILDRQESLAANLGARPLGPILMKRFERCFDAPPKVVASHHRGSVGNNPEDALHGITWLEVIEFARAHPGQFTLSTFSDGKPVCQFYYPQRQLRVQISEEDFIFINSGRCQELIPPLPIWEDEEKEFGTCDVLDAKLKELTNVADMVAARTRQLSHRLKGRRAAILERRAEGGLGTPAKAGAVHTTTLPLASSPGAGFTAVNSATGRPKAEADIMASSLAHVRSALLRHFESLPQNQSSDRPPSRQQHSGGQLQGYTQATSKHMHPVNADHHPANDGAPSTNSSLSPVPPEVLASDSSHTAFHIPQPSATNGVSGASQHRASNSMGGSSLNHTPLKHNFSRPLPPALESSQPFRSLCQGHMDGLARGQRVLPPCDRCRRLRMDCVKNLTSCAGCTKKHARCHWRDVTREELGALDRLMNAGDAGLGTPPHESGSYNGDHYRDNGHYSDDSDDDDSNPLEDLEALGEKAEREMALAERTREDEDGLRNAKELARQGLDTTALRSPTTTQIAVEGDADAERPGDDLHRYYVECDNKPAITVAPAEITKLHSPVVERAAVVDDGASALADTAWPEPSAASLPHYGNGVSAATPTMYDSAMYGGFHAVNDARTQSS